MLEDVTVTNITMRDIVTAPIFLRLGSRMRGPQGIPIGQLRRVNISNVVVSNADSRYASIISGIPGHSIEDIKLNNIYVLHQGGGTKEDAAAEPPEKESGYPEPTMFGTIPTYGFYVRHVKGIEICNVEVSLMKDDPRPGFILEQVKGADFLHIKSQHVAGVPAVVLRDIEDFNIYNSRPIPDRRFGRVQQQKL